MLLSKLNTNNVLEILEKYQNEPFNNLLVLIGCDIFFDTQNYLDTINCCQVNQSTLSFHKKFVLHCFVDYVELL